MTRLGHEISNLTYSGTAKPASTASPCSCPRTDAKLAWIALLGEVVPKAAN